MYYEGEDKWTADLHLKDRIEFAEEMSEYMPDFRYHVVSVHQYTNEELSEKGDEMALVMLINKIQNPGDWKKFTEEAKEFVNIVYEKAPEEIKQIIKKVLWALLKQMNVPNEEARELMGEIGGVVWESYLNMQRRWTYRLNEGILQEKKNEQMQKKQEQMQQRQNWRRCVKNLQD